MTTSKPQSIEQIIQKITSSDKPADVIPAYTRGRLDWLKYLDTETVPHQIIPTESLSRTLWGLSFRAPLFNAGGLFKKAEAYETVYAQGAGAYMSGSTTWNPRPGNEKDGLRSPWVPYSKSGAASNWMGMPGEGDKIVAERLSKLQRKEGFPLGASVSPSPDLEGDEKVDRLIDGLNLYKDAGVDFIEIPASSPNAKAGTSPEEALYTLLRKTREGFDNKHIPVIIKFSSDTKLEKVPELINMLVELRYEGVNFGNSSKNYALHREQIDDSEKALFDHFVATYGGALTGRILKPFSLNLVKTASQHLNSLSLDYEFHIVRTGGVESAADVKESLEAGASLVQWHSGYYSGFEKHGHNLYQEIWSHL